MSIDVRKFLEDYGVDFTESTSQRGDLRYLVCCPFHSDSSPSCGVWADSGYYKCWGCGAEGPFYEFLAEVGGMTEFEAKKKLRGQDKVSDLFRTIDRVLEEKEFILEFYSIPAFAKVFPKLKSDETGYQYVIGRGISPEIISRFSLRWGTTLGAYRHRVIIPIRMPDGKLLAYAGRAVYKDMVPKTKKSRSPHRTLYGLYELLKGSGLNYFDSVVVVEGEFDAMYLQQFGIPAVSNMGTAPLNAHKVFLLRKYAKKVVLAYDADDAGESAMFGVHGVEGKRDKEGEISRLSHHLPTVSIRLPKGRDPNELSGEEVVSIFGEWRLQSV